MTVSNPKRSPSGRRSSRRRGQAMVEFALVIPIFMLVLAGILDFGFALFSRMTVINAARDGARAAIMVPDSGYSTIPLVAQTNAVAAAAQGGLAVTVSTSADVTCWLTHVPPTSPPTPPQPCGNWNKYDLATNPTGPQSGDSVSVTVHYTYHPFFPLAFGIPVDLTSTVQMVIG